MDFLKTTITTEAQKRKDKYGSHDGLKILSSLVEKIGELLGAPATLYDLQRTKIGDFELKKAKKL